MLAEKLLMFQNRLQKVYRHRSKQARRLGITCYRLYDRDLPEFPVSIDLYGTRACMSEYRAKHHLTPEEHMEWLEGTVTVVATVLQIPEEAVYTKERRRKKEQFSQNQKNDSGGDFFEVQERRLPFILNLTDYLDTGLFLDHRITRDMVRSEATGKRVLNLFAYTGSFSVYAAAGGASYVETVDLSNTYIDWARRNFQGNGFSDPLRYRFVVADVLQFVQTLPDHAFDVVVMDPPTFSNSKKMKDILDIQRDHVALINRVLQAIRPGGVLYFSTNARRFVLGETAIRAQEIRDITRATTPFDFEGKLQRWCWRMVR